MKTRTTKWVILPEEGAPIFTEAATTIEIVDEAAGEFVEVSQSEGGTIRIDSDKEWEEIRKVIDNAFNQITDENRKHQTESES